MFLTNVRSLGNKLSEFYATVISKNAVIAMVTETWLSDTCEYVSLFNLPGFELFTFNRRNRTGGGVAIYCGQFLKPMLIDTVHPVPDGFECLFIRYTTGKLKTLAVCLYCPPDRIKSEMKSFVDFVVGEMIFC